MKPSKRLTRDDWLAAGFRALATAGPSALKAEALARALGTTKGSFYWHFKDVATFQSQMLALWREKVANEVIEEVMAFPTPAERLDHLFKRATDAAPDEFGGRAVEPAMRAWALNNLAVRQALFEVDQARTRFVAEMLAENGIKDPTLAEALYGAYIGLDDLTAKGHCKIGPALAALLALVLKSAKR